MTALAPIELFTTWQQQPTFYLCAKESTHLLPTSPPSLPTMEGFRSKSCGDGRTEMEVYGGRGPPTSGLHDMRSYSATYVSSQEAQKAKKGKVGWGLGDPELQRKKRVAAYKVYAVEGKMKGSFRKSFRWLKDRYSQVVYGWW